MLYYDSAGNKINIKPTNSHGGDGSNALVYKGSDGIAYKIYYDHSDIVITQAMFETLKKIDSPNFIKLIERYYRCSKIKNYKSFLESISNMKQFPDICYRDPHRIDMYTYHWVEKENIDILEEPKDYLLENFISLLKLGDYLADNRIGLADIKMENTICNKNSIVLIDPDMYYFISEYLKSDIHEENRLKIIYLITSLCRTLTSHASFETSDKVTELFSKITNPKKAEQILTKTLKKYKKPIEYIKNH